MRSDIISNLDKTSLSDALLSSRAKIKVKQVNRLRAWGKVGAVMKRSNRRFWKAGREESLNLVR
jgi:hypothetical protein